MGHLYLDGQNKDGSQECTTYFKGIDPVNIISEMHFSKNSPNLIVQNISRPNKDEHKYIIRCSFKEIIINI
jgi:hypothetical protein